MQNFKCAFLSLVAVATLTTTVYAAQTAVQTEIPDTIDITRLSNYDQGYLYKSVKDLKKCLEIISSDPYAFPIDANELAKITAWVALYYAYLRTVQPATNDMIYNSRLDKTGKLVASKFIELFPLKLLWDRVGKDVEGLNRFFDAWVGYLVTQGLAQVGYGK